MEAQKEKMIDLTALSTAMAVIIGLVNGVGLASEKVTPFLKFVLAMFFGLLFGALHVFGLTVELGIVAALASSGLYKVAEKIGGR